MDVIFDLDGTLADVQHRRPLLVQPPDWDETTQGRFRKNWKAFFDAMGDDPVVTPIADVARRLHAHGDRIVICSGRPEDYRRLTESWLAWHTIPYDALFMRSFGDSRSDDIVKGELLRMMRSIGYDPVLAFDDRNSVVNMWRKEGIVCCQVADGDF